MPHATQSTSGLWCGAVRRLANTDVIQPAAEAILSKITHSSASRLSYAYESWLFHYIADGDLVFLALADAQLGRRVPFAFLTQLQKEVCFCPGLSALTRQWEESDEPQRIEFEPRLVSLRNHFNQNPESDPIRRAQSELGSVKDIITQNVEQILSRGEQIELLMDRTDSAANQSLAFRRRAVGIRRTMWWKNTKVVLLIGFCVLVRAPLKLNVAAADPTRCSLPSWFLPSVARHTHGSVDKRPHHLSTKTLCRPTAPAMWRPVRHFSATTMVALGEQLAAQAEAARVLRHAAECEAAEPPVSEARIYVLARELRTGRAELQLPLCDLEAYFGEHGVHMPDWYKAYAEKGCAMNAPQ